MNAVAKADMTGRVARHVKFVRRFPSSFVPVRGGQKCEDLGTFLNLQAAYACILIGRPKECLHGRPPSQSLIEGAARRALIHFHFFPLVRELRERIDEIGYAIHGGINACG